MEQTIERAIYLVSAIPHGGSVERTNTGPVVVDYRTPAEWRRFETPRGPLLTKDASGLQLANHNAVMRQHACVIAESVASVTTLPIYCGTDSAVQLNAHVLGYMLGKMTKVNVIADELFDPGAHIPDVFRRVANSIAFAGVIVADSVALDEIIKHHDIERPAWKPGEMDRIKGIYTTEGENIGIQYEQRLSV